MVAGSGTHVPHPAAEHLLFVALSGPPLRPAGRILNRRLDADADPALPLPASRRLSSPPLDLARNRVQPRRIQHRRLAGPVLAPRAITSPMPHSSPSSHFRTIQNVPLP